MMKKIITLLLLVCVTSTYGQFWNPTGALSTSGGNYIIATTSIGDHIYAVGDNATFVYSADQGVNWSAPAITSPPGTYVSLNAASSYLYASMKLNNFDYELHYSLDNGLTWARDTVGLPANNTNTGKAAMNLRYMGNNYILAFNSSKACYKELGTSTWIPTTIDFIIIDVIAMNDIWFAIGGGKILKSTDHGSSWTIMTPSGFPVGFQGYNFASNGIDRLFVSSAPALGGEIIYLSEDGGDSWTSSNSEGQFTYANPWLGKMFAVDDYIFASVTPEAFNFDDAPPFLMSATAVPDYSVGDVSGLPTGQTNTALPFFFKSGNKLYTLFWDVYVSEPGFVGGPATAVNESTEISFTVYPNPAVSILTIDTEASVESIQIYNIHGMLVKSETTKEFSVESLNRGVYFIHVKTAEGVISERFVKI